MAIEENLELNIEQALAAIEDLQGTLTALTEQFSQQLQAAFEAILAAIPPVSVPLEVNTVSNDLAESIEEGTSGHEAEVPVDLETRETDVGQSLESDIEDISPRVEVEGDASGVGQSVEASLGDVDAPEVALPIDAEATDPGKPIEQVKDAAEQSGPVETEFEADTASAEASLEKVVELLEAITTQEVSVKIDAESAEQVAESLKKTKESAKETNQELTKKEKLLQATAISAKVLTAAFAASAAAATAAFMSGVVAEGALVSFNKQFGEAAGQIRQIDVNGLNMDLADLAQYLGSSDEEMLGVVQRLGQFGQTAGATSEEISGVTSNLVGVAGAIRAANPQMGELDQITNQLVAAARRGPSAFARLGISVTDYEIRQRAAINTGKAASSEFNEWEKTVAAADVAAEKFGDSVKTNIEGALENPVIALARLKQVAGDAIEEIGKPFISPFLEIIETGIPVVTGLTEVVASLALSAMPAVERVVKALSPIAQKLFDVLVAAADSLSPAFDGLADVAIALGNAFDEMIPILGAFVQIFSAGTAEAIGVVAVALAEIVDVLGSLGLGTLIVITQIGKLKEAFTGLKTFALGNPFVAAAAAVGLVVGALKTLNQERVADPFNVASTAAIQATTTIDGLAEALARYQTDLNAFVAEKAIRENEGLIAALNEAGISVEEFQTILSSADGPERLAARLGVSVDQLKLYAKEGDGFWRQVIRGAENFLGLSTDPFDTLDDNAKKITRSFGELGTSIEDTNKVAFENIFVSEQLPVALREGLLAQGKSIDSEKQYTEALRLATAEVEKRVAAEESSGVAAQRAADANQRFKETVDSIAVGLADGSVSVEDFSRVLALDLGGSIEDVEELVKALSDEMDSFVDAALENVPSVVDAFKNLDKETGPAQIIENFNQQIDAVERWNADMLRLREAGQTEILNLVAELGPQQSAILLDAYGEDLTQLEGHLREMFEAEQRAAEATRTVALLRWLETREITGKEAERVVKELESTLTIRDVMEDEIVGAAAAVVEKGGNVSDNMKKVASETGKSFGDGTVEGVEGEEQRLGEAVEKVWDSASEIAQAAADAAANAAADVFNEVAANEFFNPTTVRQMKTRIVTAIGPVATEIGKTMMDKMGQSISANASNVESILRGRLTAIAAAAGLQASTDGRSVATSLTNGMIVKIQQDSNGVKSAIETLASTAAVAADAAVFNTGFTLGQSMGSGLEQGISSYAGRVASTAAAAAAEAERQVRRVLDSNSPSKVWARIGEDMMAGVAVGLSSASRMVTDTAVGSVDSATAAASSRDGGVGGISVTVPVTVMGNADPSVGREIGRLAANELRSALRMEARVA